ncbi:MAG: DUF2784 domain-containing protein [Acidobacteria bacterium]|nr:DUF2784 domain-containing protein [Acidobacteriota bacterium]
MNPYSILAVAALALHLLWIGWVLLGWLLTRKRPWWRGFHLGSVVYSLLIEVFGWTCPLTFAEQWALRRAGVTAYEKPFLLHYLESLLYPDIPSTLLTTVALILCGAILAIYALRFRQRQLAGW